MTIQKRTLAILLIIFGILAIAGIVYWTFRPVIKSPTVETPSASLPAADPSPSIPEPLPSSPTPPAVSPPAPTNEDREQFMLRQRALQFAARQASYTNADRFSALQEVYIDVTPTVRAFYQGEQDRLAQEHPLTNGSWTQTTRALSSRITSELPLAQKNQAVVSVQAQQIIEAGAEPASISYREIVLTFTRTQGTWMVSRVENKALEL